MILKNKVQHFMLMKPVKKLVKKAFTRIFITHRILGEQFTDTSLLNG